MLFAQPLNASDDPVSLLDAFWNAPVEHVPGLATIARREAFAHRLTDTAKDIAGLRSHDATLSTAAFDLVHAAANHPPGALPSHLHAFELTTGDVAYAGALALKNDREPDFALLFTVEKGWETFTSLDELQREYEARLRKRLASDGELSGAATSDIRDALDATLVGIRAIDRDPAKDRPRRAGCSPADVAADDATHALRFIPRHVPRPDSSLGSSSGAWVRLRLRDAYAADTEFGSPARFEAFRSTAPGSTAVVLRRPGGALARAGAPEAAIGFFNHYSIHFAPR